MRQVDATLGVLILLILLCKCCLGGGFVVGGLPSGAGGAGGGADAGRHKSMLAKPPSVRGGSSPPQQPVYSTPPPGLSESQGQDAYASPPKRRSLLQALSPRSIKMFVGAIRDFILVAKPVESFLLRSRAVSDPDLTRFIAKAVAAIVWGLIGTSALGTLGIDTRPLVAGIGVSGFVIGFALKEVATNLLSGILLVIQRPFRAGWKIKVGSFQGVVISIDSRYVRLETDNKEVVLMPSYQVYSSSITVISKGPPGRGTPTSMNNAAQPTSTSNSP